MFIILVLGLKYLLFFAVGTNVNKHIEPTALPVEKEYHSLGWLMVNKDSKDINTPWFKPNQVHPILPPLGAMQYNIQRRQVVNLA